MKRLYSTGAYTFQVNDGLFRVNLKFNGSNVDARFDSQLSLKDRKMKILTCYALIAQNHGTLTGDFRAAWDGVHTDHLKEFNHVLKAWNIDTIQHVHIISDQVSIFAKCLINPPALAQRNEMELLYLLQELRH